MDAFWLLKIKWKLKWNPDKQKVENMNFGKTEFGGKKGFLRALKCILVDLLKY